MYVNDILSAKKRFDINFFYHEFKEFESLPANKVLEP